MRESLDSLALEHIDPTSLEPTVTERSNEVNTMTGFDRRLYTVKLSNIKELHGNRSQIAKILADSPLDKALDVSPNIPTTYHDLVNAVQAMMRAGARAQDHLRQRDMSKMISSLYDVLFTVLEIYAGNNLTDRDLNNESSRQHGWYVDRIHKAYALADKQDQSRMSSIDRITAYRLAKPSVTGIPFSESDHIFSVIVDGPEGTLFPYVDPMYSEAPSAPPIGYMADVDRARTESAYTRIKTFVTGDYRYYCLLSCVICAIVLDDLQKAEICATELDDLLKVESLNGTSIVAHTLNAIAETICPEKAGDWQSSTMVEYALEAATSLRRSAAIATDDRHSIYDELVAAYQRRLILDHELSDAYATLGRLLKQAPHIAREVTTKIVKGYSKPLAERLEATVSKVLSFLFPER